MNTAPFHLEALSLMHAINRRLMDGRLRSLRLVGRNGRQAQRAVVDASTLARLAPAD
jgi:hypothetical protein